MKQLTFSIKEKNDYNRLDYILSDSKQYPVHFRKMESEFFWALLMLYVLAMDLCQSVLF